MGKFSDTKYAQTIDSLVESQKVKLNNPYYIFADANKTIVTYFSQNIERSTLDEASGLFQSHVGEDSPFRFNKINDFFIYGIQRIEVNYDTGDNGVEANSIEGDGFIIPNTINPRPGDFFKINHVKEDILFRVTSVTTDTLDTGANVYKIQYRLTSIDKLQEIEVQVDKSFDFIAGNDGTDFKTVILSSDHKLVEELESLVEQLITAFNNIFFNANLQTFVFNHDGWYMYDPFLIEFFIRNKVLSFGSEYVFVHHATSTKKTFGMDYSRTFLRALETRNKDDIRENMIATADMISDPNSLFATRLEYYYSINYNDKTPYKTRFQTVKPDVIDHIKSNTMFEPGNENEYYNLWIAYFNNNTDFIRGNILELIKNIDYMNNLECFYALSISIFIIEIYIKQLMQ